MPRAITGSAGRRLGEALPIALGLQLARREELIIAAVGDGSYLFANPAVCHHIAEVMKLPVLVVVGNNGGWGAVAGGTKALYPDGYAARAETIPATAFTTSPDFAAIAASSRAAACRFPGPKISPACWKKRYPSYAPADKACWLTCS